MFQTLIVLSVLPFLPQVLDTSSPAENIKTLIGFLNSNPGSVPGITINNYRHDFPNIKDLPVSMDFYWKERHYFIYYPRNSPVFGGPPVLTVKVYESHKKAVVLLSQLNGMLYFFSDTAPILLGTFLDGKIKLEKQDVVIEKYCSSDHNACIPYQERLRQALADAVSAISPVTSAAYR